MQQEKLELIEEYTVEGRKRYRFRIKNTNVVINVTAQNIDEAKQKAIDIAKTLKIEEVFKK